MPVEVKLVEGTLFFIFLVKNYILDDCEGVVEELRIRVLILVFYLFDI